MAHENQVVLDYFQYDVDDEENSPLCGNSHMCIYLYLSVECNLKEKEKKQASLAYIYHLLLFDPDWNFTKIQGHTWRKGFEKFPYLSQI